MTIHLAALLLTLMRVAFAPQITCSHCTVIHVEVAPAAAEAPAEAITDTDCSDFDDLWTAAQEFEKTAEQAGADDDACDFYPDNKPE